MAQVVTSWSTPVRNWTVPYSLQGTAPATVANHGVCFWRAPVACVVKSCSERHITAGNDGSAVTTMLTKVPSGTAASAGTDCLVTGGISLKGTADTNAAGTLHATAANYTLAAGDSLAWVLTGTPTAVAGVSWVVEVAIV